MFTITDSIEINQSVETVFNIAGNYRNDSQWRKGVVSMRQEPEGPAGLGTVTYETMKMLGQKNVTVAEVVAFDDCSRTAFRSLEEPIACEGYRSFEVSGTRTRLTYSLTLNPAGWMRLIEFLLEPMFEKQVRGDLERLKKLLESNP